MINSWYNCDNVQNYDAKISDFGIAKLGPSEGQSHVTTKLMGTYGYAAPEYVIRGNYISDLFGVRKYYLFYFRFSHAIT